MKKEEFDKLLKDYYSTLVYYKNDTELNSYNVEVFHKNYCILKTTYVVNEKLNVEELIYKQIAKDLIIAGIYASTGKK